MMQRFVVGFCTVLSLTAGVTTALAADAGPSLVTVESLLLAAVGSLTTVVGVLAVHFRAQIAAAAKACEEDRARLVRLESVLGGLYERGGGLPDRRRAQKDTP